MKNSCLLLFMIFVLKANAQIINFPDANFKARLLQSNIAYDRYEQALTIDANHNGDIEINEVQDIERLDVSNSGISDLTGISNFTNLKMLKCNNNLLTNIVIDSSVSLMSLKADHNQIDFIDVNYSAMEDLNLSYNNFSSLSISNAIFYESLNLANNHISNLTLSNVMVNYFIADNNDLSSIQYNGFTGFYSFASFRNNRFSELNFPGNVTFDNSCVLYLGGNTADNVYFAGFQPGNIDYKSDENTSLDLGNFVMGRSCDPEEQGTVNIHHSPNLELVIFKNGFNHDYMTCDESGDAFQIEPLHLLISSSPALNQLCVDSGEQAFFQAAINGLGMQSQVLVNGNCTSSVLEVDTPEVFEPFTVFPVPVQNILQLQSNANAQIKSIEIYNNLGQLVQKETGNRQSIDVSRLAKGSYYLEIKTESLIDIKRFVKE